jgi:hypothetical protein
MNNSDTKNIIFCKKISKSFTVQKREKEVKRVDSESWNFTEEDYLYKNQLNNIQNIHSNNYKFNDTKSKITIQQINKKISGYKQQDILKKILDVTKFITLQSIINKMIECELKCYYCKIEMNVLYDISRELKQWTVDRIDNDFGHNCDNYYLACLECNLKRRRRSDEKFLFTKQMKLVKIEGDKIDNEET